MIVDFIYYYYHLIKSKVCYFGKTEVFTAALHQEQALSRECAQTSDNQVLFALLVFT